MFAILNVEAANILEAGGKELQKINLPLSFSIRYIGLLENYHK